MTRNTLALLALGILASAPALAQQPFALYGVLDTGVEYLANANAAGGSVTRMPVIGGGILPSRWGVKGDADLGHGQKAIFVLENGFSLSTGAAQQGARLFGRQSLVGLKGSWGQFTLGRQYSLTPAGMAESNVLGSGGFGGLASFDPYLLAARADNSAVYLGTFSALTVGASYSLGRDSASCAGENAKATLACRAFTGLLKYGGKNWGIATTYDEQRGGPGAAPMTVVPGLKGIAFTNPADRDRRYQLAGYARVGTIQLGAGWLRRLVRGDTQAAKTDIQYLGASMPFGRTAIDALVSRIANRGNDANGTMATLRASHHLSAATSLYAVASHVDNRGAAAAYSVSASTAVPAAPAPGTGQWGVDLGIRKAF